MRTPTSGRDHDGPRTIKSAVKALREGAEDYLTKPINVDEVEHLLDRLMERKRLVTETRLLRERLDDKYRFENIIGRSPRMLEIFQMIDQVAPSQASVLITGESGTGKEADRAGDPSAQSETRRTLREDLVRGAARDPARKRAVRS